MPTPKPRKRGLRRGAYADAVRPDWSADAYRWPCPQCPCPTNLRGLGREACAHCTHVHQPPVGATVREPQQEHPHA